MKYHFDSSFCNCFIKYVSLFWIVLKNCLCSQVSCINIFFNVQYGENIIMYITTNELFSELYTRKMFQLLLSAYSTISIQDTALFLGLNEDDATNCKYFLCSCLN